MGSLLLAWSPHAPSFEPTGLADGLGLESALRKLLLSLRPSIRVPRLGRVRHKELIKTIFDTDPPNLSRPYSGSVFRS
jgi:hypothetical protein